MTSASRIGGQLATMWHWKRELVALTARQSATLSSVVLELAGCGNVDHHNVDPRRVRADQSLRVGIGAG